MKKQTVIFALLTVIWCAVIFTLSSENADNSTQTSGRVIKFICNTFVPGFEEKTSEVRTSRRMRSSEDLRL